MQLIVELIVEFGFVLHPHLIAMGDASPRILQIPPNIEGYVMVFIVEAVIYPLKAAHRNGGGEDPTKLNLPATI